MFFYLLIYDYFLFGFKILVLIVYLYMLVFVYFYIYYINIIVLFFYGCYFEFLIYSLLKYLFKKGMLKLNILGY